MLMDTKPHAISEYDTLVVDDPDGWSPLRDDEDEDEEADMRVMLDGLWHRELDPDRTVCEISFPLTGQFRTANKYDGKRCPGKLCPKCYFASEIARAEAIDHVLEEERIAAIEAIDVREWRDPKPFNLGDEIDRQRKRGDRIATIEKKKKPNGTR